MNRRMVSTGRGGSGNIQPASSELSPKLIPQGSQTPSISQSIYSTGRGGAGNMRRNFNPKITRKAQDVDEHLNDEDAILVNEEDYINTQEDEHWDTTPWETKMTTDTNDGPKVKLQKSRTRAESNRERPKAIVLGRGGAGNIVSPTSSARARKRDKNDKKGRKGKNVWSSVRNFFS